MRKEENLNTQVDSREATRTTDNNKLMDILGINRKRWIERLQTENYEKAHKALNEIIEFKKWRDVSRRSSFSDFYQRSGRSSVTSKNFLIRWITKFCWIF